MALKLYSDTDIQAIADAIRAKNGSSDTYTVAEMAEAIGDIETGGGYTADDFSDLSKPVGEITTEITSLTPYMFYHRTGITKFVGNNVTELQSPNYAYCHTFYGCTSLREVYLPKVSALSNKSSVFMGCTALQKVDLKAVKTLSGSSVFSGCSSLEGIVFPSAYSANNNAGSQTGGSMFASCSSLAYFDVAMCYALGGSTFANCSSLKTLIIRGSPNSNAGGICALSNVSAFSGTPFASGGSGGTIYIPKAKYDLLGTGASGDYKAATNWSTIDGYGTITWAPIEGSIYETQYADGTVIE